MELTKKISSGAVNIVDNEDARLKIKLIDVTTTNSLMAHGQLRIANENGDLNNQFLKGQEISVKLSLGDNEETTIFSGVISEALEGQLISLEVRGNAFKMRDKFVKRSLNKTTADAVIREILKPSEVDFDLGKIPSIRRHSYIMQNGSVAEEIHRFNKSFKLDWIPYFDREGKLVLKTFEENLNKTSIIFEWDQFKKFDDGILETIVDTEIDLFDQIEIMGVEYVVASNRFFLNDRKSKSFITVTEV